VGSRRVFRDGEYRLAGAGGLLGVEWVELISQQLALTVLLEKQSVLVMVPQAVGDRADRARRGRHRPVPGPDPRFGPGHEGEGTHGFWLVGEEGQTVLEGILRVQEEGKATSSRPPRSSYPFPALL